ncbi:MAG TPA: ABC transporter permease [Vicinamibacterales bacterium]|nr:ABC transporter permease [Vicinamibacterales bacterium]
MWSDLRHAIRSLSASAGFTLVVVLTLGLGIGANTAIFSVIDGVLLRPAPVKDFNRLTLVWETDRDSGTTREPASVPDFLDFQRRSRTFESLAALMVGEKNLIPATGDPERIATVFASHELFSMLGLRPLAGRTFTANEDRPGGPAVVMIADSVWRGTFDRDPGIVGRTIRLDDRPYTIVGVMPDEADFGVLQVLSAAAYSQSLGDRGERVRVGLWAPLQPDPKALPRDTHPIFVVGRLAPAATVAGAQSEMAGIAADLERTYPVNAARGANVEALSDVVFGPVRPMLLLLLGAVALVLLVACVNVAGLLMARGRRRVREVALRSALGASGRRLARLFFAESVLLSLLAGLAGCVFAFAALRVLVALAPADVPRIAAVSLDAPVLAATLLLSLVVAIAFSMIPVAQAARVDLSGALNAESGRTSGTRSVRRTRRALLVGELALAVVLVSSAGLFIRSFWRLLHVDAGFHTSQVLKAEYQLPPDRYPVDFKTWPDFKAQHAFTRTLLARVSALPGVRSAAVAGNQPLDPGFTNSFSIVGREAEAKTWPEISVRLVTPGYFQTVEVPLVRGRLLEDGDTTRGAPVAVLNEAAAARFFPDREAIGAQIQFWGSARRIVGIVANERFHGLAAAAPIAVYTPLAQTPSATDAGVLLVRTAGDPAAQAAAVRRVFREIDPGLAVFGVEPLDRTRARSVSQPRFAMLVVATFAALALLLAAVGVHAMFQVAVADRRREIGIRLALGAAPGSISRLIVVEGLLLTAAGLALGLAGAYAAGRLAASLLFGVSGADPLTAGATAVLLTAVSLLATLLPARRAASIDPLVVLHG